MAKTDFQADPENDDRELSFCPADRSAATTLSSSQVDHYNEYGFVGQLPVYSASEATAMRDYVSSLVTDVVKAPDQRNSYSINAYHMVCAGLYDVILTPSILDLVQDIIGPNIVCWGQHLFCKQPYDPMEVPLHQDAVYWPLTPARSVTVWIALDDADEANAAMQFAPGTHRLGSNAWNLWIGR